MTERQRQMDIVETAMQDGRFTTLIKAVQTAGLADTLKGKGPYTVFAPTDEAFNKLPQGTLQNLLRDTSRLKDILLYHVVQGKMMSSDVGKMSSATTVEGQPLRVSARGNKVMINDAQVISTDIQTSNGIIHVIDTVLMPQEMSGGRQAGSRM